MLDTYAEILVRHAVSLRPGQDMFIRGPRLHHDFALRVGRAAYEAGARSVHYHLPDPDVLSQLIRYGTPSQIALYHEANQEFLSELVKRNAASIWFINDYESPAWVKALRASVPENLKLYHRGLTETNTRMYRHLQMGMTPRTAAPAATPSWAAKIFPDLEEDAAHDALWKLICHFAHADHDDYQSRIREEQEQRTRRAHILNSLEIREIYIRGAGNDLRVSLSKKARWTDGTLCTQAGQVYFPNFPSSEIFTVPDCRTVNGTLVASKAFRLINGSIVKDLVLVLQNGVVVDFDASEGKEAFRILIDANGGARRLGEIGLVGNDSLIGQSGLFFDCPNCDENAASHIALGQSVPALLEGDVMSEDERASWGYNESSIHVDIMFGSSDVSVVATKSKRGKMVLLEDGNWSCVD